MKFILYGIVAILSCLGAVVLVGFWAIRSEKRKQKRIIAECAYLYLSGKHAGHSCDVIEAIIYDHYGIPPMGPMASQSPVFSSKSQNFLEFHMVQMAILFALDKKKAISGSKRYDELNRSEREALLEFIATELGLLVSWNDPDVENLCRPYG